ncbi:MAG: ArsS family sensor histidine kinase [Sulfurovum sp.]|nr:ArsS family sensor histidine kinase [Sulfurovum sp.]
MNIHSLRAKITVIFMLSFLSIIGFLFFYIHNIDQSIQTKVTLQYKHFSDYFRESQIPRDAIEPYLESFGFKADKNARTIMSQGQIIADARGYQVYLYKQGYYYHVQRKGYRKLFHDLNDYTPNSSFYLLFGFILLSLLFTYLWLLNSLKPLHILKENINKFANGEVNIDCKSSKKDEIAIVSNAFDHAVTKIGLLLNSRQLFLRTVMHELKTPIAKGRIVCALLEDEIQEKRLIFIFEKLEQLINDFAKVEEIVSHNYTLQKQHYALPTLIDKAIGMLLIDNIADKITLKSQSQRSIEVDSALFTMVIKNLLDNALKYASDHKAIIISDTHSVAIHSKGKVLSQPIESYFKPFHNEINMQKQGMGLGLYIVKSIVDMHSMDLEYNYKEGHNIFTIYYAKDTQ